LRGERGRSNSPTLNWSGTWDLVASSIGYWEKKRRRPIHHEEKEKKTRARLRAVPESCMHFLREEEGEREKKGLGYPLTPMAEERGKGVSGPSTQCLI